jgi:hypothetical protein
MLPKPPAIMAQAATDHRSWADEALRWLDHHSGALTVLASAAPGITAFALAYFAWRTRRATQSALQVQRDEAQRATEPLIRAHLGSQTETHVDIHLRNVGLGPAVDLALSPREFPGSTRGVPVSGDRLASLLSGEEGRFRLARFVPVGQEARSEFDLVYSDARQSLVKRQLWVFYLAPDVVTMREHVNLIFEVSWPELTTQREHIIDANGKVHVRDPIHGPYVEDPHPLRGGTTMEPDNLSSAWLLKYGSYLTGSTRYLGQLRAVLKRP